MSDHNITKDIIISKKKESDHNITKESDHIITKEKESDYNITKEKESDHNILNEDNMSIAEECHNIPVSKEDIESLLTGSNFFISSLYNEKNIVEYYFQKKSHFFFLCRDF